MAEVVAPIIHMNGTSKERLKAALEEAYNALYTARDKLRECAPNGRDYYPEPGRMDKAVEQHRSRQQSLEDVMQSIAAEMEAIDEQGGR